MAEAERSMGAEDHGLRRESRAQGWRKLSWGFEAALGQGM